MSQLRRPRTKTTSLQGPIPARLRSTGFGRMTAKQPQLYSSKQSKNKVTMVRHDSLNPLCLPAVALSPCLSEVRGTGDPIMAAPRHDHYPSSRKPPPSRRFLAFKSR